MIQKRFTEIVSTQKVIDNLTGKEHHCLIDDDLLELLNELHEETQSSKEFIEQLQEELVLFKEAGANMGIDLNTQITALKQENEQLQHDATILIQSNQDYRKENEQLKQQKQQYKGQRDYLLFVIERTCSKELFVETKSYLKEVE